MTGQVIDLDAHRPHDVAHIVCNACGVAAVSVHPVGADPARLECRCGAQDSRYCDGVDCPVCARIVERGGRWVPV